MFLLFHAIALSSLAFALFLGLSPILINHQNKDTTTQPKKTNYNLRLGLVLAIAILIIFLNYSDIVALSHRPHRSLFSGSEYDNWLLFVFPLIPIFWAINTIHNLMFAIIVAFSSGFLGIMLILMYTWPAELKNREDTFTPFQKFCNTCYFICSMLFFSGALAIPAIWLLLIR